MSTTIKNVNDLKTEKVPLTVVNGVGETTADKLKEGGITTVMMLSMVDPRKLTVFGIQEYRAKEIVKAADQLISQFHKLGTQESRPEPEDPIPPEDREEKPKGRVVMINGKQVSITPDDYENAKLLKMPIEEYISLPPEQMERELRIARSTIVIESGPLVDHQAFDLEMNDPLDAPSFIQKRREYEINAAQDRHKKRLDTFDQTASFVSEIIEGEDVDGEGNTNPMAERAKQKLENMTEAEREEALETEVYIPNLRKTETQAEAVKKRDKSVQQVIDEIL